MNLRKCILKEGIRYYGKGESYVYWAIFNASDVMGLEDEDIITTLGLVNFYQGPGMFYSEAGYVIRKGKKVLVKQHCGMDI